MSSERTWVDSSIRLPEWLGLCLRDEPRDADHLARLCETAIAAAIGPAAGVAVALEGVSGTPREGLNVANAVIEVAKWRLAKIPSAALVSSLSSRATGEESAAPACRFDHIEVRFHGAQIEHLRCETIVITAEAVVGRLSGEGQVRNLELESAGDLWVRAEVRANDARDALVAQSPFIVDGSLRFLPGGGMVADGRVRLGIIPLSARLEGKLTVGQSQDLLFSGVSAKVGGRPLPQTAVNAKLREINPVFSVRPLHAAGLPVELLPPEVDGSVMRLRCRAIRNGS